MHETCFFFKKNTKVEIFFRGLGCWFWVLGFLMMIGSQIPRERHTHTYTHTEAKVQQQQQHQALKDPPPQPHQIPHNKAIFRTAKQILATANRKKRAHFKH